MTEKMKKSSLLISTLIFYFFVFSLTAEPVPGYDEALKNFQNGKYEDSLAKVREIFTGNSNSFELRMLAAACYLELNKYEQSLQHLNLASQQHPTKPEIWAFMSAVHRKSGRLDLAARSSLSGLARFKNSTELRIEMARVYHLSGQLFPARAQLDIVLASDPNNLDAVYLDGLIFIKQKRFEEAQFRLRQAVLIGADRASYQKMAAIYNNLAFAVEKTGDENLSSKKIQEASALYKEASSFYEKAMKLHPETVLYKNNYIRADRKI